MGSKEQFVISDDLGENGRLTLKSHDDVTEWISAEIEYWQWLQNHRNDNAINQANQSILSALTTARNINEECVKHIDTPNYEPKLQALQKHVGKMSSTKEIILSRTAKAKFIEQVKAEIGPAEAAYCVAFLMSKGIAANGPQSIRGAVSGVLFEYGIKKSARAEKKALSEIKSNFESEWAEYRAKYHELGAQYEDLVNSLEELQGQKEKEFSDSLKSREDEFQEAIKNAQKEWNNVREAFLSHMVLEAPVDYWERQKRSHRKKAIYYSSVSIAFAVAGSYGLYRLTEWLLIGESGDWEGYPGVTLLGLPLWHVVVLSIFVSLGVWGLRVLTRLMMSELHLMTDSGERVVMAKTYQALMKDGQGPADNDRSLILQTLFRSANIGLIKEETSAVTPVEWLSKLINK